MNGFAARMYSRARDGDVSTDRNQRRADDGDSCTGCSARCVTDVSGFAGRVKRYAEDSAHRASHMTGCTHDVIVMSA